jgi:hypothetical protein
MTVRLLAANATLSTSAGSWKKAEFANLPVSFNAASLYDDINTTRTSATFQVTNGVSLQGVFISIRRVTSSISGTYTVGLFEGATQRAISATLNVSDIPEQAAWIYVTFGTPYTASSGINYTIKCACNTSAKAYWNRSSTAGDYGLAVIGNGDDSAKIASGDTMLLSHGVTLTVDESFTLAATGSYSLVFGDDSILSVPNPTSPITLAFGAGLIQTILNNGILIGSVGTPIESGKVTLTSSASSGSLFDLPLSSSVLAGNFIYAIYGTSIGTVRLKADVNSAANQPIVTTLESIPVTWAVNDIINLVGKDSPSSDLIAHYQIREIATKQITLKKRLTVTMTIANPCVVSLTAHVFNNGDAVVFSTTGALPTGLTAGTTYYTRLTSSAAFNLYETQAQAIAGGTTGRIATTGTQSGVHTINGPANLDYLLLAGAGIVNINEAKRNAGVHIISTNLINLGKPTPIYAIDYFKIYGVYFENCAINPGEDGLASATTSIIENCLFYANSTASVVVISFRKTGGVIRNIHVISPSSVQTGVNSVCVGKGITCEHVTLKNISFRADTSTNYFLSGNACSVSDLITSGYATIYQGLSITGFGNNLDDIFSVGSKVAVISVGATTFNDLTIQRSPDYGLYIQNAFLEILNSIIGVGTSVVTSDIYLPADTLSQVKFTNCQLGSRGVSSGIIDTIPGTYLRFVKYNQTPGDYRSFYPEGHFLSGSGIIDASTDITTGVLTNRYNASSDNVSGCSIFIEVFCQINNAAYYAGTHVLPTLSVDYDDGTVITDVGSANTLLQSLQVSFSATTSYNPLGISLLQKTDASTINSKVTWSALSIKERVYGKQFIEKEKTIVNTTDDIILNFDSLTTNTYISEASAVVVSGYTNITINHSAGSLTVSSTKTAAQIYDYTQYDLSIVENMDKSEWYTTTNGTHFKSIYDLLFNTGTFTGFNFTGCNEITGGDSTFSACSFSGALETHCLSLDDGSSVAGSSFTKGSDTYALNIVVAGAYDLTGATFLGYTNEIHITATTGTVIITIGTGQAQPNYISEGATVAWDMPLTEYGLSISGLIAGSQVVVYESGTTTELDRDDNTGTTYEWTVLGVSDVVDYTVQKAGYLPIRYEGISLSSVQSSSGNQIVDRAYSTSSGITFGSTGTVTVGTKLFGLTAVSTGKNWYSFLIESWISEASLCNVDFPILHDGDESFTLFDGWEFTSTNWQNLRRCGFRYLSTGLVQTATFSGLLSIGDIGGNTAQLQQSDGGTQAAARTSGDVDQMIQVYGDATHGDFDRTGHLVAKVQVNSYLTAAYDVITDSAIAALADKLYSFPIDLVPAGITIGDPGITGVTITDHGASPVTWNSKGFSITITDSGTNSGENIARWINYNLAQGGTFQGKATFNWHDMVLPNGDGYKTIRGPIYGDSGAAIKGVRVLRGTDAHPDFNLFTADDGTTYAPPQLATITITGSFPAGTLIQLYDITNDEQLFLGFSGYSFSETYSVDRTIRIRASYCDGATSRMFKEETIGEITEASQNLTYLLSLQDDNVYEANAVDGSSVTGISIVDATMRINIDSTSLSLPEIYAYNCYWLFTEEGIVDESVIMLATDTANYTVYAFKIKNIGINPLVITGGYMRDSVTGYALDIIDTTGNTIFLAPDHVTPYAAGAEATIATVQAGLTAQGYTGGRAGKIDYLDVAVSSVGGPTVAVLETATSIVRTIGSDQGGTITTIQAHDDNSHATGEVSGQGLTVEITATGTDPANKPLQCSITGYYAGSTGHYIDIQAYNYILAAWEVKGQMLTRNTPFDYTIPLSDDHISGAGELKLKLIHSASTYINAHRLYIDFVEWEVSDGQSQVGAGIAAIKNVTDQFGFTFGRVNANTQMIAGSTTAATSVEQNFATMATAIEFLLKSIKNKREVKKVGSTWVLYIYDNDGVTPILQKNVKDVTLADISDLVAGVLAIEEASVV